MRKPKLLKESMMSEIDILAQESDDVKKFLSKLKPFLQKFAADAEAYADPKVLKGIVGMYFDAKGNKIPMDESVSKLTEMIRAEVKKVLNEDTIQKNKWISDDAFFNMLGGKYEKALDKLYGVDPTSTDEGGVAEEYNAILRKFKVPFSITDVKYRGSYGDINVKVAPISGYRDPNRPKAPGNSAMVKDDESVDIFTGEDYLNGNKWHDYKGLVKQYPVFKKLNKAFVEKLIEKLPEIRSHALNKLENTLVKQFAKVGVTITPTEGDDTSVSFTVTNTGMKESAIVEAVPTLRKLKVGAIVTPKIGPHKGQKHEVIHDFGNGKYNIKPVGLKGAQIKYKLGAAGATEDQFDVVQESIKKPSKR